MLVRGESVIPPWGSYGGYGVKTKLQIQITFSEEVFNMSLWVYWWLIVAGILIAQRSLLLGLKSLRTLHMAHNLILLLQGVALALEGVCGLVEGLVMEH